MRRALVLGLLIVLIVSGIRAIFTGDDSPWPATTLIQPGDAVGVSSVMLDVADDRVVLEIPQFESHPRLSKHLRRWVGEQAADFVAAYPASDGDGTESAATLTGTWQLLAMSEDLVGVSTEVLTDSGEQAMVSRNTTWYNAADARVVTAGTLLQPEASEPILDEAAAELAERLGDIEPEAARSRLANAETQAAFTGEGDLLLAFGDYPIPAASDVDAVPVVRLSDPDDTGLLSEQGQLALEASRDPVTTGLVAPPVPPTRPDVDCAEAKCVALTFDDGPDPESTSELLDLLWTEDVPATFFLLGSRAAEYPELVRREADEGHEIANHSWSHPDLAAISRKDVASELDRTAAAIQELTGTVPTLLRPPFGSSDDDMIKTAKDRDLAVVLWDVDTYDWDHRDPAQTLAKVQALTSPGSVILMHDIHSQTIEAVPEVIAWLEGEGYLLVTVGDLFDDLDPGQVLLRRD